LLRSGDVKEVRDMTTVLHAILAPCAAARRRVS